MTRWEFLVPQLPVRDVEASQRWYRDVLGLGINWLWEDNFGSVGMDHVELFLAESEAPHPAWCCVFVDDVDEVHAACRERGADICSPLEGKPWNVREFSVRDPDGNVLRISQGVENPVPRAEFSYPGQAR